MNDEKYIGLDVHQATIVVAVLDSTGKLVMESILETEAATILQFFASLRETLSVTFEEGTWSTIGVRSFSVEGVPPCNHQGSLQFLESGFPSFKLKSGLPLVHELDPLMIAPAALPHTASIPAMNLFLRST